MKHNQTTQGLIDDWQALFMLPGSIWLPIVAMTVIAFGTVMFNESSVKRIRADSDQMAVLMTMQKDLLQLQAGLTDAETGQRGFLLTRDPAYLLPYHRSIDQLTVLASRVRLEAANDPSLLARVQKLEVLLDEKESVLRETVVLAQDGQRSNALIILRTGEGRLVMDTFYDEAQGLLAELDARVLALRVSTAQHVQWSRIAFAALGMLTLALLVVSVRLLVKDFWRLESARQAQTSERQRLEHVVDERTAELSDLTTYLQSVTEQEKAELARNLHDELGGLLTAAKMDLSWLQGRASAAEPEVSAKLEALDSGIDEAMNIKRRVVENLRPALLDHFGLPTALQSHFMETCEHAGLRCRTRVAELFQKLPQELAIALFRVGQESLTNIIRHAHASNVELIFEVDDANYRMSITDDGVGIPSGKLSGIMSHGLVGMRHRIGSLNGQFLISANTPTGTRIDVVVPRSA